MRAPTLHLLVLLAGCGGAEAPRPTTAASEPAVTTRNLSTLEGRLYASRTDPVGFARVLRELSATYRTVSNECAPMEDATYGVHPLQLDDDADLEHVLRAEQSTAIGSPLPCHTHFLAFFDGPVDEARLIDVRHGIGDPCNDEYVEAIAEGAVLHTRRAEACGTLQSGVHERRTLRVREQHLLLGDPEIEQFESESQPEEPGRPGEPCSWPSNLCDGAGECIQGVCVARTCATTSDCALGFGCDDGRCVEAECFVNVDPWAPRRDCPDGQQCRYSDDESLVNSFGHCE